MTISERIHQLRIEKNLTQTQLAKIAGVSDKAISAWELGTRDPKLKFIQNICVHFGIDINSFIDEESDDYKIVLPSTKKELPAQGGEPLYPPEYDLLTQEDKELVDNMIRSLAKKQQTP